MELFSNIQSWWELPSIAHFCSLFRAAFDLLDFDIEELEEAIITDGLDGSGSPLLVELLVRLLQGCLPGRTVTPSNVDSCLRKLFRQKSRESNRENLFPEGEFRHLPLRRKVEVLHDLCDFRLEADDVLDLLKNLETESLRVEPLGYDDRGSTYWYFYGTRLYREDNSLYHPFRRRPREKEKDREDRRKKRKRKKELKESDGEEEECEEDEEVEGEPKVTWQVECYTEDDWRNLAERFESCESRLEKSLLQTLKEDFLPEIPRLFEEKEKIQQRRMQEFAPRRSSGRVQKLKEKKEEEERKLAEELIIQDKKQEKRRSQDEEKKKLHEEEKENAKFHEDEKTNFELERRISSDSKKKLSDKKDKKRRKTDELSVKRSEDHEDILQERLLSQEISPNPSPQKSKEKKHKEKRIHHRKHHNSHRKTSSRRHKNSLLNTEDSQVVSDTSNKENNCLIETLSENEDMGVPSGRPQVYSGRKTNNSLSSMAFSLSPATVVPEPPTQIISSPPNKRRIKSAHSLLQTADDLKTGMYKVLEHLRDHEDAWPFLDPVDDTFAPNYYAVIRRPMYISKMESRLDNEYYSHLSMFEADFKLMMDNCKLYNGPESEYTHMAYSLEKVFAKLKCKYLETDLSSDEEIYIDMSFQESSKRKNKKRNSTEENEKDSTQNNDKKKRGRKKKKVGRKPKRKEDEAPPLIEKPSHKIKGRRSKEKKEKSKSKTQFKYPKEAHSDDGNYNDEEEQQEKDVKLNGEKEELEEEGEDEDDDEDDFNEPLLLVREDPYPEEDDSVPHPVDTPPSSDEEEGVSNKNILLKKWTNTLPDEYERTESGIGASEHLVETFDDDDDDGEDHNDELIQKVYNHQTNKRKREMKEKKDNELKNKRKSKNKEKKNKILEKHKTNAKSKEKMNDDNITENPSIENIDSGNEAPPIPSESDVESDREGVLLYYSNNDEFDSSEEKEDKTNEKYLNERHNELFGEIDDIELEEKENNIRERLHSEEGNSEKEMHHRKNNHTVKHLRKNSNKKKHKHGDKHHHHHHHKHHHHKSKVKEGKHHHHHHKKKTKHNAGKESPSKKVLKVEEVYDVSEEDRNIKDAKDTDKDPSPARAVEQEEPSLKVEVDLSEVVKPKEEEKDGSPKKKKDHRKLKHEKHSKNDKKKGNKTKNSKKDNKKKSTKKKKKPIAPANMVAIDALSAATEQTLKDITVLLDDPEVPKFTGESAIAGDASPSHKVTSLEFEAIALKIENDYRKKLQMDTSEEKKVKKKKKRKAEGESKGEPKKKRKAEDEQKEEGQPKKKKIKKEKQSIVKEEKEKDNKTDLASLDNIKELFKDIKDGRIKPGAIIKSKDIAKKEGVVKKENKGSSEGKPKNKQNPFGKINKQENSKLTTLIAKAKESRIGLVPTSEVGDSPKLSLGSIILSGDIGSGKHSVREPNSPDEDEKIEKWDSPWENRWEKADIKDESSLPPPVLSAEEEDEKEEFEEECIEQSPERSMEEVQQQQTQPQQQLPPSPRGPEIKQERATPNLSAWFRAFGGPKLTAVPRKKMDGRLDDDEDNDDEELVDDEDKMDVASQDDTNLNKDDDEEDIVIDDRKIEDADEDDESGRVNVSKNLEIEDGKSSPDTIPEEPPPSPRPLLNTSPEPPLSPEKPPETPWFDKLDEKEDEPIWKKNKTPEEEDPYKFEEEELDRAREEAKKLEVERQRKASVSSSGLSDPSPLNIDSDRSPAAFSSEGERSPLTKSPATRSPMTPGFGSTKQISPATEKSPSVAAYSPRYDTGLSKGFSTYDTDKNKYQANGTLKVGFYQDMTDKSNQDKSDASKTLEQKAKESPIYSPTVPYVSPFYSNKDPNICKQKSPGRYGSFYQSVDTSLDKPKTPIYYSTSAPSTPSDRPSPAAAIPEDKPKNQYNYYNYDPNKPLTDQYKNTGSNAKSFYGASENVVKTLDQSPIGQTTPLHSSLGSPVPLGISSGKSNIIQDKAELQPPKKRQMLEHMAHQQSTLETNNQSCSGGIPPSWENKQLDVDRNMSVSTNRSSYTQQPIPNLSQMVSRYPDPESEYSVSDKGSRLVSDPQQTHPGLSISSKNATVQPPVQFASTSSLPQHSPDLQSLLSNRSVDLPRQSQNENTPIPDISRSSLLHQPVSGSSHHQSQSSANSSHLLGKQMTQSHQALNHLQQPPPAAHQKPLEAERPGSRNMSSHHHSDEKSHGYIHQKTMWTSSLSSSIATSLSSSLSSLVSNATMASFALAGQKGFGSLSSEHLAQLGMDRATLASLGSDRTLASLTGRSSQNGGNLFSHDLIPRTTTSSQGVSSLSSSSSSMQSQNTTNSAGNNNASSHNHTRSSSSGNVSNVSNSSVVGSSSTSSQNFDISLARSYASMMTANQTSPLFARSEGSLPRSLSGSSSPFLPQSPGLGAALGMPGGSSRTPTPAHQQSLSQSTFPSIPRDPISQSHPSLQIPSLNSITSSQAQNLSHLNAAASLAPYSGRDSLSLMNQSGRSPLVGAAPSGLVDPTQQIYQQYLQRHQLAQEELLFRSAGASQLAAHHQSMMIQQGLMSAAAAGNPYTYPPSLSLRSGPYQGVNRPWF